MLTKLFSKKVPKPQFVVDYQGHVVCLSVLSDKPKDALSQSIAKWEFIVEYLKTNKDVEGVYNDGNTCALCIVYFYEDELAFCARCPIALKTGKSDCENTPWRSNTNLTQAQAELDFLRSL